MFSWICVWINGWVNNRKAGVLRRYHSHYDVTVMFMNKRCLVSKYRKSCVHCNVTWSWLSVFIGVPLWNYTDCFQHRCVVDIPHSLFKRLRQTTHSSPWWRYIMYIIYIYIIYTYILLCEIKVLTPFYRSHSPVVFDVALFDRNVSAVCSTWIFILLIDPRIPLSHPEDSVLVFVAKIDRDNLIR